MEHPVKPEERERCRKPDSRFTVRLGRGANRFATVIGRMPGGALISAAWAAVQIGTAALPGAPQAWLGVVFFYILTL